MSAAELSALSCMLAPVGAPAAVVVAGRDWELPAALPDVPVVLWGRPPAEPGLGARALATNAVGRIRALTSVRRRPPRDRAVLGVHALRPPALSVGARGALRNALLGGAAVELSRVPSTPRVIDAVLAAAGVAAAPQLRVGAGGTLLAAVGTRQGPAVLRAAMSGTAGDPLLAASALRTLSAHPRVPQLLQASTTGGVNWTLEARASGTRPRGLTAQLVAQVADFAAGLPRNSVPASTEADLRLLQSVLPVLSGRLRGLSDHLDDDLADLPATARHGDLWSGNLLVERGRLSAVLDWDAFSSAGVPGTDLLHLLATERRLHTRRPLGAVCLERPWEWDSARAAGHHYWPQLGVDVTPRVRRAVGISWWAGQTASDLRRTPSLAHDDRWVTQNVGDVVEALHAGL